MGRQTLQRNDSGWGGWEFWVLVLLSSAGWLAMMGCSLWAEPPVVWSYLGIMAWEWAILGWALIRYSRSIRWEVWMVTGLGFRLVGLGAVPLMEDDYFRYLWDGWRLVVSGNPYGSAPESFFNDATVPPVFQAILDQINYPEVRTIYGPVTQLFFGLAAILEPGSLMAWKGVLLGMEMVGMWALMGGRPGERDEASRRGLAFYAWCPLGIFETAFNAHPDAIGVVLVLLAWRAWRAEKWFWMALWGGAAVGAKIFAVLILPFLLWKRSKSTWLLFVGWVGFWQALSWAGNGMGAETGMGAFLKDWEYNSSGYALLRVATGSSTVARGIGYFLFVVLYCILLRKGAKTSMREVAPLFVWVFLSFFFFCPTLNPWYGLWWLPFVGLSLSWMGVGSLVMVCLSYVTFRNLGMGVVDGFQHPGWVRWVEFGTVFALGLGEQILQGRRKRAGENGRERKEETSAP